MKMIAALRRNYETFDEWAFDMIHEVLKPVPVPLMWMIPCLLFVLVLLIRKKYE